MIKKEYNSYRHFAYKSNRNLLLFLLLYLSCYTSAAIPKTLNGKNNRDSIQRGSAIPEHLTLQKESSKRIQVHVVEGTLIRNQEYIHGPELIYTRNSHTPSLKSKPERTKLKKSKQVRKVNSKNKTNTYPSSNILASKESGTPSSVIYYYEKSFSFTVTSRIDKAIFNQAEIDPLIKKFIESNTISYTRSSQKVYSYLKAFKIRPPPLMVHTSIQNKILRTI
jgi:hypothetical protein